jgi:hypothetical protein
MNSQWPFAMKDYGELAGMRDVNPPSEFMMAMSPFGQGREMIPECLPHTFSILYCTLGEGMVDEPTFQVLRDEMCVRFNYITSGAVCAVTVKMAGRRTQPRPFAFGFNGRIVFRRVDMKDYTITFDHGAKELRIIDPLARSVQDFIRAVDDRREPLVGASHILSTTLLLKHVDDAYAALEGRRVSEG